MFGRLLPMVVTAILPLMLKPHHTETLRVCIRFFINLMRVYEVLDRTISLVDVSVKIEMFSQKGQFILLHKPINALWTMWITCTCRYYSWVIDFQPKENVSTLSWEHCCIHVVQFQRRLPPPLSNSPLSNSPLSIIKFMKSMSEMNCLSTLFQKQTKLSKPLSLITQPSFRHPQTKTQQSNTVFTNWISFRDFQKTGSSKWKT